MLSSALIEAMLKAAIEALGNLVLNAVKQSQTRSDQINLGRSQVTAAVTQENADAEHRASDVMLNVPSVDRMLADLVAGKPFI